MCWVLNGERSYGISRLPRNSTHPVNGEKMSVYANLKDHLKMTHPETSLQDITIECPAEHLCTCALTKLPKSFGYSPHQLVDFGPKCGVITSQRPRSPEIRLGQSGKHRLFKHEQRIFVLVSFRNMELANAARLPGQRAGNDDSVRSVVTTHIELGKIVEKDFVQVVLCLRPRVLCPEEKVYQGG